AFKIHKWMRRPPHTPRLISFRKTDLLRCQPLLAAHSRPGGSCMTAVQKLLIDIFVTAAAVPSRQMIRSDGEAVMIFALLSSRGLMAIKAIHAFLRVLAHLIFVND